MKEKKAIKLTDHLATGKKKTKKKMNLNKKRGVMKTFKHTFVVIFLM